MTALRWHVLTDHLAYAHTRTHTYVYDYIAPGTHRIATLARAGGVSTRTYRTASEARAHCDRHAVQTNEERSSATA